MLKDDLEGMSELNVQEDHFDNKMIRNQTIVQENS